MVQVAYAIGIAKPLSIHVDSYGTVVDGKLLNLYRFYWSWSSINSI